MSTSQNWWIRPKRVRFMWEWCSHDPTLQAPGSPSPPRLQGSEPLRETFHTTTAVGFSTRSSCTQILQIAFKFLPDTLHQLSYFRCLFPLFEETVKVKDDLQEFITRENKVSTPFPGKQPGKINKQNFVFFRFFTEDLIWTLTSNIRPQTVKWHLLSELISMLNFIFWFVTQHFSLPVEDYMNLWHIFRKHCSRFCFSLIKHLPPQFKQDESCRKL